jgi:hypothetical protein
MLYIYILTMTNLIKIWLLYTIKDIYIKSSTCVGENLCKIKACKDEFCAVWKQ